MADSTRSDPGTEGGVDGEKVGCECVVDKRGEWRSRGERGFCNVKFYQLEIVVKMSNDAGIISDDPSDVDEECGGRPVGSRTCGDEGQEPCGVDEVECDGEREVAVLQPGPKSEEKEDEPSRVDTSFWSDS